MITTLVGTLVLEKQKENRKHQPLHMVNIDIQGDAGEDSLKVVNQYNKIVIELKKKNKEDK